MKQVIARYPVWIGIVFLAVFLSGCPTPVDSDKNGNGNGNGNGLDPSVVETPVFSVPAGTYATGFTVAITCTTGDATILYTTGGASGLDEFDIYTGPITITGHTTIWAIAIKDNMTDSAYCRVDYAIIPDDTGNLIGNGDFGLGRTLWMTWANQNLGAAATFDFSGNEASITTTSPGPEEWAIGLRYAPPIELENGRIFTLSFNASASVPRTVRISIGEDGRDLNNNGDIYDKYLWRSYSLTSGTESFVSEFAMSNPTDDAPEFAFYLGKQAGHVTIDNVSLTVRDPVPLDPSTIPDPAFRQAIAANAGVAESALTELHLASIIEFNPEPYVITDLTGIGQLTGLRDLRLWGTDLDSLEPLLELDPNQLEELQAQGDIKDVAMLSILTAENFPSLHSLDLGDADKMGATVEQLIDLFAGLPVMRGISLDSVSMTDQQFDDFYDRVVSVDDLTYLSVRGNDLTTVSVELIGNITGLGYLRLDDNEMITDISALTALTTLYWLDINGTGVTDLQPLRDIYDAGGFREDGSGVGLTNLGLDLTTGTASRAVIDYLESRGVIVEWHEGNLNGTSCNDPESIWEYPGLCAGAFTTLTVDGSAYQDEINGSETGFFKFDVDVGDSYVFTLAPLSEEEFDGVDLKSTNWSQQEVIWYESAQYGGGSDPQAFLFDAVITGTIYVAVRTQDSGALTTTFTVQAETYDTPDLIVNDEAVTGQVLVDGGTRFYKLNAVSGQSYVITVVPTDGELHGIDVRSHDETQQDVIWYESAHNGGGSDPQAFLFEAVVTGTIYVVVGDILGDDHLSTFTVQVETYDTPDLLVGVTAVTGQALVDGGTRFYKLNAVSEQSYVITVVPTMAGELHGIDVRSHDETQQDVIWYESAHNGGGSDPQAFLFEAVVTGTIYVVVGDILGDNHLTTFTVQVETYDTPDLIVNDEAVTGQVLVDGGTRFYKLNAVSGQSYVITVVPTDGELHGIDVRSHDETQQDVIWTNGLHDGGGSDSQTFQFEAVVTGTIYVVVGDILGDNHLTTFTISVALVD